MRQRNNHTRVQGITRSRICVNELCPRAYSRTKRATTGSSGSRCEDQRQYAKDERKRSHQDRSKSHLRRSNRSPVDRLALRPQITSELDDQDGILACQSNDQHHTNQRLTGTDARSSLRLPSAEEAARSTNAPLTCSQSTT